jgi:hypothetical protein
MERDKMTYELTTVEFKEHLLKFISLYKATVPKVTELENALLDVSNCTSDHPSSPKKPNLTNIKSTGEKALQRAIFNEKYSFLDYQNGNIEKVTWLDLELPVILNINPRRCSLDLIGALDGIPLLCELKYFEKSPSNHPLYAIFELLMYRYFIQCNYQKLDKYEVHHHLVLDNFKWDVIVKNVSPVLIVAGNTKYWEYWLKKISTFDLMTILLKINKTLGTNMHLFEIPDEDFIMQKGEASSFCPIVTGQQWRKVIHHFN